MPGCHLEMEIVSESMVNCGCIHNSPISGIDILLKNKIELPKTFAVKVIIETENDITLDSKFSNNESKITNQYSSPIYIINSSFLI